MQPTLKQRLDYHAIGRARVLVKPCPVVFKWSDDLREFAIEAFIVIRHSFGRIFMKHKYSGMSLPDALQLMSDDMHKDNDRIDEDEDRQIVITCNKTHFFFSYRSKKTRGGPWKVSKKVVFDDYFDPWHIVNRSDKNSIDILRDCVTSYHSVD